MIEHRFRTVAVDLHILGTLFLVFLLVAFPHVRILPRYTTLLKHKTILIWRRYDHSNF